MGLGSGRWSGTGRGSLRVGTRPRKWMVNRDTPGLPLNPARAGKALFWYPRDAREDLKAVAACGSSAGGCLSLTTGSGQWSRSRLV